MRILNFLIIFSTIAFASANKKKLQRGKKIFGKAAIPIENDASNAVCTCATVSNCWLVGDPHLKSFHNHYDQVSPAPNQRLNIYSHDGFDITCSTYSRDLMDHIKFGDIHEWHIDDCQGRQGWLPHKEYTYSDGSTIKARVYCRKSRNKMHINLLLTKNSVLTRSNEF